MKKIKDLFLASAVVCGFSALINLIYFIESIVNIKIIFIIFYALVCLAGIFCVVVFLSFRKQSEKFFIEKKNTIKIICIVALVCSLLGGIVAFYAYYVLNESMESQTKKDDFVPNKAGEVDGVEIIDDKRMAKYIDDLNRLEEMKSSGIITEDKYEILKKQILSQYMKGE